MQILDKSCDAPRQGRGGVTVPLDLTPHRPARRSLRRLYQGEYGRETVYSDDPGHSAGSRRRGPMDPRRRPGRQPPAWVQRAIIAQCRRGVQCSRGRLCATTPPPRRCSTSASARGGGTAALETEWVRDLAGRHPGRVAVGLDARGRDVAVRGWVEGSGRDLLEVARSFDDAGVAALVVTEIGRDGTLEGPALDQLADVLAATRLDVVASGGVGSLDNRETSRTRRRRRRIAGAIVGEPCTRRLRLPEAVDVVAEALM